jgi:hypothetical protein
LDGIYLHRQLTDCSLVEVLLLLIGLTHIYFLIKTCFDPLGKEAINRLLDCQLSALSTITDDPMYCVLNMRLTCGDLHCKHDQHGQPVEAVMNCGSSKGSLKLIPRNL